tara:strand:- start:4082 stop:5155 length:1074 start_codon:yes stop_codon:yes gene_type:complete
MKVYFDYSVFTLQKYGGISKYIVNLVENFSQNINPLIVSPFYKNIDLKRSKKAKKFFFYNRLGFLSTYTNRFNKFYLNYQLKVNDPDILHYTYFNQKNFYKTKAKILITEYDLIKEIFYKEEYSDQIEYKKKLFDKLDHIICISNNTKKDLIENYNLNNKNISVVHLAVNKIKNFNYKKINIKPFILFVGSRNRYKNFHNAIKAYSQSNKLNSDFDFVCFGGGKFTSSEIKLFRDLKIGIDKVHFFDGTEDDLNFFYKNARLFIFPSLYEGFGIPLLEAMNMECPVICSNTSCFPEIAGDAAIKFDPKNIEEIQNKTEEIIYKDDVLNDLKKRGNINLSKYSWKNCSYKTEEIYKKL